MAGAIVFTMPGEFTFDPCVLLCSLPLHSSALPLCCPSAIAAETLSNEVYGNDEAGVVLTCYTPDDDGISGDCQYYNLYLNTNIRFTDYRRCPRPVVINQCFEALS